MTCSSPRLLVILSAATVASTLFFGSSVLAYPCPLGNFNGSGGIGNQRNPNGSDGSNGSGGMGDAGRSSSSGGSFRQSDTSSRGRDLGLMSDSHWQLTFTNAESAGAVAVAGLFAIALFYKARRCHHIAPTEVELLHRYPQLEHPEMMLTLIPQEALPSTLSTEFVRVR